VCEFWTLKQSKNHVMMGSIDAWFYKYIAGIQLNESYPAFKTFTIKPILVDSLGSGKGELMTLRGKVGSEWRRSPGLFTLKVQVPFNTSAVVYLPGSDGDVLTENEVSLKTEKGIEYLGFSEGRHQIRVHSGVYNFKVIPKQ